jgi:hypothetical protein
MKEFKQIALLYLVTFVLILGVYALGVALGIPEFLGV